MQSRRAFLKTSLCALSAAELAACATGQEAKAGRADTMTEYRDEKTGARVRVLTPGKEQDQLIYQTHPMWTPGMGFLVFNSTRTRGRSQPHSVDMATGAVRCLVDAATVRELSNGGQEAADDWTLARKDDCLYFRVGDDIMITAVASGLGMPNRTTKAGTFTGLSEVRPISMSIDADERVLYFGLTLEPDKRWGLASVDLASGEWDVFKETDFR
ncbi:MAG: hypothetical protein GY851_10485, partial [bacterium]|nr:hypothetical protein [bacterium]